VRRTLHLITMGETMSKMVLSDFPFALPSCAASASVPRVALEDGCCILRAGLAGAPDRRSSVARACSLL
jgi:hypothetical protein